MLGTKKYGPIFKCGVYFSKFLLLLEVGINTDNRIFTAAYPIHMVVFYFLDKLYVGRYID